MSGKNWKTGNPDCSTLRASICLWTETTLLVGSDSQRDLRANLRSPIFTSKVITSVGCVWYEDLRASSLVSRAQQLGASVVGPRIPSALSRERVVRDGGAHLRIPDAGGAHLRRLLMPSRRPCASGTLEGFKMTLHRRSYRFTLKPEVDAFRRERLCPPGPT